MKSSGVIAILVNTVVLFSLATCTKQLDDSTYHDIAHISKVFGKQKQYRLYLPKGYAGSQDRFPVIYFFHGWGGRHFKDDNAKLEYTKIKGLVDKYHVILVMWDGNYVEKQPRPYNIGTHEEITSEIQMKDYFLELVGHIDSTYRTKTDRGHRGIIGFSMGGFLSYFLAGKYPDKVGAAVNMTGSPEFFVGTPKVNTLYPVRYTFKNLKDVKLRFHNSTADELTYLNAEVDRGARWEGGLSYDYWQFVGGHVVDKPGETEVFERAMKFVASAFESPLPPPKKWTHYDLYSNFDVWGYQVKSNLNEPGFIDLKRVTRHGLGLSTQKWLPNGPAVDNCLGEITTAPIYKPRETYQIKVYHPGQRVQMVILKTDDKGSLHFPFDQNGFELGIFQESDGPEFICVDYSMDHQRRYLRIGEENNLSLTILNRGQDLRDSNPVKITLSSADSAIQISNPVTTVQGGKRETIWTTVPFRISCRKKAPADASPSEAKFKVRFDYGNEIFEDEVVVPVFFDGNAFPAISVDDGRKVRDSVLVYGKGNGDGMASPGEQIMVYSERNRLRLYTDDPWVVKNKELVVDEVLPAKWPDGFTLTSIIKIDERCPSGHTIECLASYETKSFMPIGRKVTWGKVAITVK